LVKLPKKIEQLVVKIHQSSWNLTKLSALQGWTGDILARIYKQPLAILATSSYAGPGKQERGIFSLDDDHYPLGDRILLVDDLVDSGITLQQTIPG